MSPEIPMILFERNLLDLQIPCASFFFFFFGCGVSLVISRSKKDPSAVPGEYEHCMYMVGATQVKYHASQSVRFSNGFCRSRAD